jgi:hypothetical protein
MRHLLTAAAMAASILAIIPVTANAAPVAGADYAGTITKSVDTGSAYVGEPVTLTHVTNSSGSDTGGTMYGSVTRVVKASQGRPAQLQMTFHRLVLPSGTYAIDGVVTGMQANTKSNAAKEVGGAVVGMLLGNALLKTVFHASGGGILGAAGGYLIAKNSRQNMVVPAGSAVKVTLRTARRQARRY